MKTIKHITIKKKKQNASLNASHKVKQLTVHANSSKKSIKKANVILVEKTKVEYLLLFNTLLNYYILLVSNNLSNDDIKHRLEELVFQMRDNNKLISRDTTDIQIKNIVNYLPTQKAD
jgi:hypothetical protein